MKNECENYLFKCSFLLAQNEDGTNEESQDNRSSRDHPSKALSPTLIIANDGCIVYEYYHKVSKQALKTGQKTNQLSRKTIRSFANYNIFDYNEILV